MKKAIFIIAVATAFIACKNEKKESAETEKSTAAESKTAAAVTFPYKANYSSQFNDQVADKDVEAVLNSYKYWENADFTGMAGVLSDSIYFQSFNGFVFDGTRAGLIDVWTKHRDSLVSVKIDMDVWVKSHSVDKKEDYVNCWYKEIDTYKSGKIDSAYYADINQVVKGKIRWFGQYRQEIKMK